MAYLPTTLFRKYVYFRSYVNFNSYSFSPPPAVVLDLASLQGKPLEVGCKNDIVLTHCNYNLSTDERNRCMGAGW